MKIVKKNVFGEPLEPCCFNPLTGYFRDGYCRTDKTDVGRHVVCAIMTEEFLEFTKNAGNDLSTPMPAYDFPGLKPGDQWCLCALRWQDAFAEGVAPPVKLESCEDTVLDLIPLMVLKQHALQ